MERKKLLEKALNRFERTNLKNLIIETKSFPEPEDYAIRIYGFELRLSHQENSQQEKFISENYSLTIFYLPEYEHFEEFKEETGNFGRIKEVYNSIKNKVEEERKIKIELEKKILEKKLKGLERRL